MAVAPGTVLAIENITHVESEVVGRVFFATDVYPAIVPHFMADHNNTLTSAAASGFDSKMAFNTVPIKFTQFFLRSDLGIELRHAYVVFAQESFRAELGKTQTLRLTAIQRSIPLHSSVETKNITRFHHGLLLF
ncbi:hypothetical protein LRY60_03000 [Candidatus Woesebacteria bacterium]|nr:hypothetical protein [Candidatus Woesebacteria bacterium]